MSAGVCALCAGAGWISCTPEHGQSLVASKNCEGGEGLFMVSESGEHGLFHLSRSWARELRLDRLDLAVPLVVVELALSSPPLGLATRGWFAS